MTRAELEARRLQAIPGLSSGKTVAKLAKQFHVSRITIYRWQKMLAQGESELKARKTPGRPPRMSHDQLEMCRIIWEEGQFGYDHWTAARFAKAIQQQIHITFSHDHVGRIMHKLGLR